MKEQVGQNVWWQRYTVGHFQIFVGHCPMSDRYFKACVDQTGIGTRSSLLRLKQPYRKSKQGQASLSYLGPSIWNKLPDQVKLGGNVNTFKHNIKKHFLELLSKKEKNIYIY